MSRRPSSWQAWPAILGLLQPIRRVLNYQLRCVSGPSTNSPLAVLDCVHAVQCESYRLWHALTATPVSFPECKQLGTHLKVPMELLRVNCLYQSRSTSDSPSVWNTHWMQYNIDNNSRLPNIRITLGRLAITHSQSRHFGSVVTCRLPKHTLETTRRVHSRNPNTGFKTMPYFCFTQLHSQPMQNVLDDNIMLFYIAFLYDQCRLTYTSC